MSNSVSDAIVLAVGGELYQVGSAFDLVPFAEPYAAAGSGQLYALGVLSDTKPSREAVKRSLWAAEKHDPYVGAPLEVKSIERA